MFRIPDQERLDYLQGRLDQFDDLADGLARRLNELHDLQLEKRLWMLMLKSHILSAIQRFDKHSSVFHEARQGAKKVGLKEQLIQRLKELRYFGNLRKVNKILNSHNEVIHGFRDPSLASQEIGPVLPSYEFPKGNTSGADPEKRAALMKMAQEESDQLLAFALLQLPAWIVENFESNFHSIPVVRPKQKIFHLANLRTNYTAMLVARYLQEGAQLYYYQHGGVCGENQFHVNHHIQAQLADKFVTFGWQIKPNDIPGRATYRFNQFRKDYQAKRKVEFDLLLGYPKIKVNNVDGIAKETHDLLNGLKDSSLSMIARPHPFKKWENQGKKLSFIQDARVTIDAGRQPIQNLVAKSKMVIMFMHPTTNFLECVFVDHPIMATLTNDNPSEVVKPYYQFFIDKGVFHPNMESLSKYLNGLDIAAWWNEITSSSEYQDFKKTFARD